MSTLRVVSSSEGAPKRHLKRLVTENPCEHYQVSTLGNPTVVTVEGHTQEDRSSVSKRRECGGGNYEPRGKSCRTAKKKKSSWLTFSLLQNLRRGLLPMSPEPSQAMPGKRAVGQ